MSVSKDRLQGGDQNSSGNHIWNVGPLEILSAGRRKVPVESVCILCTHAWGAGAIFYLQVGCPNFRTLFIDINEVFIEVLRRILRTNTTTFQVHSLWGHLWQRKAAFSLVSSNQARLQTEQRQVFRRNPTCTLPSQTGSCSLPQGLSARKIAWDDGDCAQRPVKL